MRATAQVGSLRVVRGANRRRNVVGDGSGVEMVEQLPSSSESKPPGDDLGCDASELAQVHRIFRWLYRELPLLIREVGDGDRERAAIVGDYAKIDFYALHLHHESEDLVLWDRLTERAPACALHVAQMRAQHAEVAAQLAVLEPLLPPWRESADAAQRDTFATGVERLRDTLFAHLGEEEEKIVPVAAEMLTQREWDEMGEHARASLQASRKEMPRDVMSLQLGMMLATIPEDERAAWTRANLPVPVRILYSLLLKRRYDRAMAELYPDRPIPAMT